MSDPATEPETQPASETTAALPVAGWYPDPEHATQDRWWDGASWSDHRRPREGAGAAVVPAVPVAPAYVPAGTTNPYGAPSSPYGAPSSPYGAASTPAGVMPYGGAPQPQPYPAYGAYGYAPPAPQNVPALVGFIIALVGFGLGLFTYGLLALAGGIVSIVGLVKSGKMKRDGLPNHRRGMALTGVIVGFSSIVLTILAFVVYFAILFSAFGVYGAYDSYDSGY